MGIMRIPIHLIQDDREIRKIAFFLAQESGQQEMGKPDGAVLAVRDDKDDIDLREQSAEQLQPLKLFPVRG
jgi:hypothetical protein